MKKLTLFSTLLLTALVAAQFGPPPGFGGGPGFGGPQFGPPPGFGGGPGFGPGGPGFGPQFGPPPGFGPRGFEDESDQFRSRGFSEVAPGVTVDFGGPVGGGPAMPNFEHFDREEMTLAFIGPALMSRIPNPEEVLGPLCPDYEAIGAKARELLADADFDDMCSEIEFAVDSCKDALEMCENMKSFGPRGPGGKEITCPVDNSQLEEACKQRMQEQQGNAKEEANLRCEQAWLQHGANIQRGCQQPEISQEWRDFRPSSVNVEATCPQPPQCGEGQFLKHEGRGERECPSFFCETAQQSQQPQPFQPPQDGQPQQPPSTQQPPAADTTTTQPAATTTTTEPQPSATTTTQPATTTTTTEQPPATTTTQPATTTTTTTTQSPSLVTGLPIGGEPPEQLPKLTKRLPVARRGPSPISGLQVGFPQGPGDFGPPGGFGPGGPGFGPGDFGPPGGFGPSGSPGFGPGGPGGFGGSSPEFCDESGFKANCLKGFDEHQQEFTQQTEKMCKFEAKMMKRGLGMYCKQKEKYGDPYERCVKQATKGCEKMKEALANCKKSATLDEAVEFIKKKARVECARMKLREKRTQFDETIDTLGDLDFADQTRMDGVQREATVDKIVLTAEELEKIKAEIKADVIKDILTLLGLNKDSLEKAAEKQRQQIENLKGARDAVEEMCEKVEGSGKEKCEREVQKLDEQLNDLGKDADATQSRAGGILGVLGGILGGK